jgi:hypothetical protein
MYWTNTLCHRAYSCCNKPLHVKIFTNEDALIVENNLQLRSHVENSTKSGLKNIAKRYALLANKNIIYQYNTEKFSVRLPLLSVENSVESSAEREYMYIHKFEELNEAK